MVIPYANKGKFHANNRNGMQTKEIVCKQKKWYANQRNCMQTKEIVCKQKKMYANKRNCMQTKEIVRKQCHGRQTKFQMVSNQWLSIGAGIIKIGTILRIIRTKQFCDK